MLKIISGIYRGKKIYSLSGNEVRPLSAFVKKSLFDILKNKINASEDCKFLDLYAGTGSVGLEALSQGVKKVVFVDKNKRCIEILYKNLALLGVERDRYEVHRYDILSGIHEKEKFDIIFVGAPYKGYDRMNYSYVTMKNIWEANILFRDGWIILQHCSKEKLEDKIFGYTLFRKKAYGDTILSFYKLYE
jgi:16S rRNA (guanine(966)-N(2))-methyltransferase RsmD